MAGVGTGLGIRRDNYYESKRRLPQAVAYLEVRPRNTQQNIRTKSVWLVRGETQAEARRLQCEEMDEEEEWPARGDFFKKKQQQRVFMLT